jgi:hypothetical protein
LSRIDSGMVRSVETIRKDMDALEAATASLAADFKALYTSYLETLGRAVRRQGVIATYHLCTQVYPEAFLALSVGRREALQQDIQRLGRQAQDRLQHLMEPNPEDQLAAQAALEAIEAMEEDPDSPPDVSAEPDNVPGEPDLAVIPDGANASDGAIAPETAESAQTLDAKALIQSVLMAAMTDKLEDATTELLFTDEALTPTQLAKQHLVLEQRIRGVLQRVSNQINQCLRESRVLPDLPEEVLEAATAADSDTDHSHTVPNLLNVLVAMTGDAEEGFADPEESEDKDDNPQDSAEVPSRGRQGKDPWATLGMSREQPEGTEDEDNSSPADFLGGSMTHLAAINLRLSDIEFADVQASLWRGKIRTSLGRLRKVGKQYKKAQRELAIAEAEQAWRAVWYDKSAHDPDV